MLKVEEGFRKVEFVSEIHWVECDGYKCSKKSPRFLEKKHLRGWKIEHQWSSFGNLDYCPDCWVKTKEEQKLGEKQRLLAKLEEIAASLDDLRDALLKFSLVGCGACKARCEGSPSVCKVTAL